MFASHDAYRKFNSEVWGFPSNIGLPIRFPYSSISASHKVCTKCDSVTRLEDFHRTKTPSDGRTSSCKSCNSKWSQKNYIRNRNKILAVCKIYSDNNKEKIATYSRKNYKKNRVKILAQNNIWLMANKDRHKAAVKRWHLEHREQELERLRRREVEFKDELSIKRKKYYEANKEKFTARTATRRAKKRNQDGGARWKDLQKIKSEANDICHYCGKKTLGKGNFDHKIPIVKGGMHSSDNIVWSCVTCNRRKHAKDYDEFKKQIASGIYV